MRAAETSESVEGLLSHGLNRGPSITSADRTSAWTRWTGLGESVLRCRRWKRSVLRERGPPTPTVENNVCATNSETSTSSTTEPVLATRDRRNTGSADVDNNRSQPFEEAPGDRPQQLYQVWGGEDVDLDDDGCDLSSDDDGDFDLQRDDEDRASLIGDSPTRPMYEVWACDDFESDDDDDNDDAFETHCEEEGVRAVAAHADEIAGESSGMIRGQSAGAGAKKLVSL